MPVRRSLALVGATTALLLSGTGIASADDVYNNLDTSIDATAEIMPLNVGGPNGTTTLAVNPTNEAGGKTGCNLTASTTLKVSVGSSNTSVATVSPSSVTFTSCGDTHQLTVTPVGQGSTTVSLSQVSNDTGGTFNLAPATFTVNVTAPAPANTAPSVSISGVSDGTSYAKGSVPTATCNVTDAEDGPSSFPATLSAVSGDYASDGLGSQTASCSYTDAGGLTASSSVTYSIIDPSPPVIGYTLDPATPGGQNGWYTGEVKLTWNVSEPESPNSVSKTGCVDQDITADQVATDYTCSASSAGGSASQQTVTIKRDGTAPVVSYDSVVSGTLGSNGWYTSDVTARFTATDATSGFDSAGTLHTSDTSTSQGEGSNVIVNSPAFTDFAGNTADAGTASQGFKIDKTAPYGITFSGGPSDGGSYYYGSVPPKPTCDATDDVSGFASCVVTGDANPNAVGGHSWTATATDNAGNQSTKSTSYTVLSWNDTGFYNPVNMGGTLNTVKAGSTVPMKFNVYAGSELTDTSVVKSFTSKSISCSTLDVTGTDPVEFTTTGGTSLRYDSTGGQFIQNWKTPSGAGTCYVVTMTTQDGSTLSADFKLK
jgi:hypothetical protein